VLSGFSSESLIHQYDLSLRLQSKHDGFRFTWINFLAKSKREFSIVCFINVNPCSLLQLRRARLTFTTHDDLLPNRFWNGNLPIKLRQKIK